VVFVLLFIKPITNLYGSQFDENLQYLIVLATCSSFFTSLINVYNQVLLSKGRNWFIFWSRFGRDLAVLLVFVLYIKQYYSSSVLMSNLNLYSAIIYLLILVFVQYKSEKQVQIPKEIE
jgi:Na+-driven multidrug efflux pump